MTFVGKPRREAGAVSYDTITGKGRVRCIRGPITEAQTLRDLTIDANPGSTVRYEQIDHGLGSAYFEVLLKD